MLTQQEIGVVQKSLTDEGEERIPFVFQALADVTRLKIFRLLANHKDLCVTDIAKVFQVSVPAISYQMKIMEVVGLVRKERMGRMICYELKAEDPLVKRIMQMLKEVQGRRNKQ